MRPLLLLPALPLFALGVLLMGDGMHRVKWGGCRDLERTGRRCAWTGLACVGAALVLAGMALT